MKAFKGCRSTSRDERVEQLLPLTAFNARLNAEVVDSVIFGVLELVPH